MLNIVWPIFIIISFSFAIFSGNLEKLNSSILESTKDAINLSINLLGTICFWNGIMKIASNTRVIDTLNNLTLEEHYNFYEKNGLNKKEIIKKIAKDRNVSKNEIYQYFI